MPVIVGLAGNMSFSKQAKSQWVMAVLDKVDANHGHTPGSSTWARLRRTMPHAALALLQQLESVRAGPPRLFDTFNAPQRA